MYDCELIEEYDCELIEEYDCESIEGYDCESIEVTIKRSKDCIPMGIQIFPLLIPRDWFQVISQGPGLALQ